MAASESVSAESTESSSIFGAIIRLTLYIPANQDPINFGNVTRPQACLDMLSPGDRTFYNVTGTGTGVGTIAHVAFRGNIFSDGRAVRSGFCAVLPPNSPSCIVSGGNDRIRTGYLSATSRHPGGVNISLFDGAVRFVSNTINAGNRSDPQSLIGLPSPYGVWGGMATIGNGETVSL